MPKIGETSAVRLYNEDCREVMVKRLAARSVDSIVTDPPYAYSFMGKDWDSSIPDVYYWRLALRVIKPGGYMLAFGGTRTFHRLAVAIEDAGWEICDCLSWLYGTGFPKSKACLKPAWEPILLCRRSGKVLDFNIDDCRIGTEKTTTTSGPNLFGPNSYAAGKGWNPPINGTIEREVSGRWPANVVHDGSEEVIENFPITTSPASYVRKSKGVSTGNSSLVGVGEQEGKLSLNFGDSGSAARFFYTAKASRADRDEGLEEFDKVRSGGMQATLDGSMLTGSGNARITSRANGHPTVKPTALMQWLIRLITPPNGIVFDPFMGSGSTGKAAILEGRRFIGCENDTEHGYFQIAQARIRNAKR